MAEWEAAIGFLTDVGAMCDDTRQEFILLSDVLGVSSLVETLNGSGHREHGARPVPHDVVPGARARGQHRRRRRRPARAGHRPGGRPAGRPLAGAEIDVWQCTEDGSYDVQQPDVQPAGNGRGLFHADDEGRFRFRTVVPWHYPIPTDGPVGALLGTTRRHPYRPAHVHLLVSSPAQTLTTHLFVAGSPYLEQDAVFAVKSSLIVDFVEVVTQRFRHPGRRGARLPAVPARRCRGRPGPRLRRCRRVTALRPRRPADAGRLRRRASRRAGRGAGTARPAPGAGGRTPGGADLPATAGALGGRLAGRLPARRDARAGRVAAAAVRRARELEADGCVAVGGGSAVGLGKTVALAPRAAADRRAHHLLRSEMTPVWGLTEDGRKRTGRDPAVLPRPCCTTPS